jgi:hypothetical protein
MILAKLAADRRRRRRVELRQPPLRGATHTAQVSQPWLRPRPRSSKTLSLLPRQQPLVLCHRLFLAMRASLQLWVTLTMKMARMPSPGRVAGSVAEVSSQRSRA